MKKILFSIMTSVLLLASSQAQAGLCDNYCGQPDYCCDDDSFYVGVFGGANWIHTSRNADIRRYKTGYIVGANLGYKFCNDFRAEFEYAYRRNKVRSGDSGHFQSNAYMANLLWDLPLCNWGCNSWDLKPYVGAGIGYSQQRLRADDDEDDFSERRNGFAWQVLAGVAYPIFCNTDLSLDYRFHKGRLNHVYNHSLSVGLRYNFGL